MKKESNMPERKPAQSSELLGSGDRSTANVEVSHEEIARLAYVLLGRTRRRRWII
jgi:hypothetical protein